jgi:hypothetical protein
LPAPALRNDVAKKVEQLKEWFLIFDQRVPAAEADKILAMLKDEIPILVDLSRLKIEVFGDDDPKKIEQLPLWYGVSYNRDYGFGRIISAVANQTIRLG